MTTDEPLLWERATFPSRPSWGTWAYRDADDFLSVRIARPLTADRPAPVVTFGLKARRLRDYDVLAVAHLPPLVGGRSAAILEREAPTDVQLIPADVRAADGPIGPYWVVNAIRSVQAIDYERSLIHRIGEGEAMTMDFRRLALRPEAMGDVQVARDSDYLPFLYVARPLAQALTAARLRGLRLVSAEKLFAYWRAP